MKLKLRIIAAFAGLIFILSCDKETQLPNDNHPDTFDVLRQNKEITGQLRPFELISDPTYIAVSDVDYLEEQDRVLLYKSGADIYVYPQRSMYVEIVNDEINDIPVAITYCPLTHSGLGWNRELNGETMLLTASGYLYKDNLMPLDVNSESIFNQMLSSGFRGKFESVAVQNLMVIETIWKNVEESFPLAKVFRNNQQKSASTSNNSLNSQNVQETIDRLAYGVTGIKNTIVMQLKEFTPEVEVKIKIIAGLGQVQFVGSGSYSFITAFRSNLLFRPLQNDFPAILEDESGTQWDIFGEAVNGPKKGEILIPAKGYMALDWAWSDIFSDAIFN